MRPEARDSKTLKTHSTQGMDMTSLTVADVPGLLEQYHTLLRSINVSLCKTGPKRARTRQLWSVWSSSLCMSRKCPNTDSCVCVCVCVLQCGSDNGSLVAERVWMMMLFQLVPCASLSTLHAMSHSNVKGVFPNNSMRVGVWCACTAPPLQHVHAISRDVPLYQGVFLYSTPVQQSVQSQQRMTCAYSSQSMCRHSG